MPASNQTRRNRHKGRNSKSKPEIVAHSKTQKVAHGKTQKVARGKGKGQIVPLTLRSGEIKYKQTSKSNSKVIKSVSTKVAREMSTPSSFLSTQEECKQARVPTQHSSNCWLNAAIMSFFVSEKMSKASKPIRQAMLKPSSSISNVLTPLMRRDLRQVALVINAVPKGILTPKYSTAALIPGLNAIDKQGLTTPRNRLGAAKGQAHNPLWFYSAISQLLLPGDFQILKCDLTKQCSVPHDTLESAIMAGEVYNGQSNSQNIEVIMIEAGQETAHSKPRKQLLELISGEKSFKARGRDWVLDSVAMLDTSNSHFGGVITCNGKPHTFDGITGSRLHQKSSWKTIVELFKGVGRKIPTPSPEDFEYNIHTGYSVFAFVPKN